MAISYTAVNKSLERNTRSVLERSIRDNVYESYFLNNYYFRKLFNIYINIISEYFVSQLRPEIKKIDRNLGFGVITEYSYIKESLCT